MTPLVALICRFCGAANRPGCSDLVERYPDGTIVCNQCGKAEKEQAS